MTRASWVQKRKPDGTFELVPKDEVSAWMEKHYPDAKKAFPIKFKKIERGSWVWRDGKLVQKTAQIIKFRAPYIQGDIEPFRNIAIDRNEIIGGRRQRRDMMKARNLIDGNDLKGAPTVESRYEPRKHEESVVQSIKKSLYHAGYGD